MKLTPDQIAFIHRNLCDAGYMASADALVEHIRDVERERKQGLSHWVEKCSRIGAERDRLKAAMEKVAGMEPSLVSSFCEPCSHCEEMIETARKALGKSHE